MKLTKEERDAADSAKRILINSVLGEKATEKQIELWKSLGIIK